MRAAISIQKLTDAAESSWQMPNRTITPRSRRFGGTFVTQSISGSDKIMTAHAYTEMSMPAADSVMLKSAAMSVSRPMGMNSDVLNTKVESVIPTSGTQNLIDTSTTSFPRASQKRPSSLSRHSLLHPPNRSAYFSCGGASGVIIVRHFF